MRDDELFSMSKKRFSFTEDDLRQSMTRFASEFEVKDRTSTNYKNWKNKSISIDSINRYFGSFDAACKHFGIEHGGKKDHYTNDELLEFFEQLWRWRKQPPSLLDFPKYRQATGCYISPDVFKRRFGDYKKFCANFADYKLGVISKDVLLERSRPTKVRKPISDSLRHKLIREADSRCQVCGKSPLVDSTIHLEIDHITPFSKGGTNDPSNLRVLCNLCNRGRSNKYDD